MEFNYDNAISPINEEQWNEVESPYLKNPINSIQDHITFDAVENLSKNNPLL